MLPFAQYGIIRECVFVNRIYSSYVELYVLFSLYSTLRKSIQSHSYELENRTVYLVTKMFCQRTQVLLCSNTFHFCSYLLDVPRLFPCADFYTIQSNDIRTVTFGFPATRLLASHRGPNREHLTDMWHLLTLSSCLTENKFCPFFTVAPCILMFSNLLFVQIMHN